MLLRALAVPLQWIWLLLAMTFMLGLLLHCAVSPRALPVLFQDIFQDLIRYGKARSGRDCPRLSWMQHFFVPKRWFFQFYLISVIWNGFLLVVLIRTLFFGYNGFAWLKVLVNVLNGEPRDQISGGEFSAFMVLVLLWINSVRRLIECLFISVFSEGMIHLIHYSFGLVYYVLLGFTVLCQAPFHGRNVPVEDLFKQICWRHSLGLLLYIWAAAHQHRCIVIFANLRKSKSGEVINVVHSVPYRDWFERVSCPHYFAELLIYIALGVIFGIQNYTWCLVVMYVFFSQALEAVLSHEYYLQKFDTYPKHRKAFIPFIF
ncbi:polyprenal reductase isoform X1 [Ambystoma mexicanum]|uniref:polyprenal reductase isoform X1 n=1 Tax=Ambystoma mexicanum TaxID=8296 RepID=UPI0037E78333